MIQRYAQLQFFRKRSETTFSTLFCAWFSNKNVSHFAFCWAICVLQLFVNQTVTSYNMKLTWSFYHVILINDQKVKTKTKISWERKEVLRWNKKYFSSFLKDFQLPKVVSDLRVHLKERDEISEDTFLLLLGVSSFQSSDSN